MCACGVEVEEARCEEARCSRHEARRDHRLRDAEGGVLERVGEGAGGPARARVAIQGPLGKLSGKERGNPQVPGSRPAHAPAPSHPQQGLLAEKVRCYMVEPPMLPSTAGQEACACCFHLLMKRKWGTQAML